MFMAFMTMAILPIIFPATAHAENTSLLEHKLTAYIVRQYQVLPDIDPDRDLGSMAQWVVFEDLKRLQLPESTSLEPISRFVAMVRWVESSGKREATSCAHAMSFYQFKPDSVITALNRLAYWQKQHGIKGEPPWAALLRKHPEKIYALSSSLQALLAMVNITQQKGSDRLLRQLLTGKTEAAKKLYFRFHHTKPDKQTIALVNRVYPKFFGK